MDEELRILMLEDEPTDAELAERTLREAGLKFSMKRVEQQEQFIEALVNFSPNVVLADWKLPQFDGLSAVNLIRTMDQDMPVIIVSGVLSDQASAELIHAGANDYVLKDRLARLPSAIQRAVTEANGRRERRRIENALHESEANLRASFKAAIKAIADTYDFTIKSGLMRQTVNAHPAHAEAERDEIEQGLSTREAGFRASLNSAFQAIGAAVEMRDPYTVGHQRRIAELSTAIARELGMEENKIEGLSLAAAIHEIGMISVPADLLTKSKLSLVELQKLQGHAKAGFEIVRDINLPWPIAQIILQHHERIDGSGYPNGLKGEEILLEARILAVADVMESMLSYRPYKLTLGLAAAISEIQEGRGSRFDPAVVDACKLLFLKKGFSFH